LTDKELDTPRPRSSDIEFAFKIIHTVCHLSGSIDFSLEAKSQLRRAGVLSALRRRDTAKLFDYLVTTFSYQGVSDAAAETYVAEHGNIRWQDIERQLLAGTACEKLSSHWAFHRCNYEKIAKRCSAPAHLHDCPLPRHPLRNGRLNQMAFSLFLFLRDVTNNDLVGWIDRRISSAIRDQQPHEFELAGQAIIEAMRSIYGVSDKVLTMALSTLLLCSKRRIGPRSAPQ
jgi:hypothetical protein